VTARPGSRLAPASGSLRYLGSQDHDITSAIGRWENELVVDKLTFGGFNCSISDHAFRNMVIVGVSIDMCVLGTARVAAELG